MCGIAGELATDAKSTVDPAHISPMAKVLVHRGPDGWGFYVAPHRRAMLIHLRLAIVDIPKGHQPLANEDGTIWVSCNGEIYGFSDLKRELTTRGHVFRTNSDSEVLIHLYEEYGERFVEKLRGEYAFALYDERKSTLLLVRDRFGIKPLYYVNTGTSLLFASEIKALVAGLSRPLELDRANLYRSLCSVLLPSETIFEGVKQVEPGTYLKGTTSETTEHCYWEFPLSSTPTEKASGRLRETHIEEFEHRFTEAVSLRCHGDVPVGVYLSGGVDSNAVATILSRLRPVKFPAFTVGFEDEQYDESGQARAIAQREQLDHHELCIGSGDLRDHFLKSLWHSETPVINTHGTAKHLLSELASSHVKVVLTGEGADELLAGYSLFTHLALLEEKHQNPASLSARSHLRRFLEEETNIAGLTKIDHLPEHRRVTSLFGYYPYSALRVLLHQQRLPQVLTRSFRIDVHGIDPLRDLASLFPAFPANTLSSRELTRLLMFKTTLPNYILNFLGDRQEMAHSVEGRLPFLDHELVSFVFSLPLEGISPPGDEKRVLRTLLGRYISDDSVTRRKKMFLAPSLDTVLTRSNDEILTDYLSPQITKEVGVFAHLRLWLIRKRIALLPKHSYDYSILEAFLIGAMSLHAVYDFFCRRFAEHSERFSDDPTWRRLRNHPNVASWGRGSSPIPIAD